MSEYIGYKEDSPFPIIDGSHPKYAVLTDEEIVRCRDCKFVQDKNVCAKHSFFSAGYFYFVKPDDYCAWGEKR